MNYSQELENLIIVGDRVLIKPKVGNEKTKSGLYLPPGVQEKEVVQYGYVMKVGPGYPLAQNSEDIDESWKRNTNDNVKYIPLQVKEGDLAIFLQKGSVEVVYKEEKYFIVPQHQILMVEREMDD